MADCKFQKALQCSYRRLSLSLGSLGRVEHAKLMQREITYELSDSLVKMAARYFVWRRAGPMLARCGVAAAVLILPATIPDMDWWRLAAAALVIMAVPFGIIGSWFRYYRRAPQPCDNLTDRRIIVCFDPDTITFETAQGSSAVQWILIDALWRFPEVLLLLTGGKPPTYSILPTEPLNSELRSFIEDKIRAHGGDVD